MGWKPYLQKIRNFSEINCEILLDKDNEDENKKLIFGMMLQKDLSLIFLMAMNTNKMTNSDKIRNGLN